MKKIFSLLVMCLVMIGSVAVAQERQVRLPNRPNTRRNVENFVGHASMEHGYWCAIEVDGGSSVMINKDNVPFAGLQYIGGYRFSEFFRAGLGVGARYYISDPGVRDRTDSWAFPFFVNLRGNMMTQEVYHTVPYWSISAGVVARDGIMFQPSVGFRTGTLRNAFIMSLGYRYQQMDTRYNGVPKENDNVNCVSITLGYEF